MGTVAEQRRGLRIREHLAPVRQLAGIDRHADPAHRVQIDVVEHLAQVLPLLHPHPVLAGDRAAEVDAESEDLARQLLGAPQFAFDPAIEEDERVQVAIARMEDVGDPDPVLFAEPLDLRQSLAEARARHDAVLHDVVRAQPPHRRERALAALPDAHPVVRVAGDVFEVGLRLPDDFQQQFALGGDLLLLALQLDDQ